MKLLTKKQRERLLKNGARIASATTSLSVQVVQPLRAAQPGSFSELDPEDRTYAVLPRRSGHGHSPELGYS